MSQTIRFEDLGDKGTELTVVVDSVTEPKLNEDPRKTWWQPLTIKFQAKDEHQPFLVALQKQLMRQQWLMHEFDHEAYTQNPDDPKYKFKFHCDLVDQDYSLWDCFLAEVDYGDLCYTIFEVTIHMRFTHAQVGCRAA